MAIFSIDDLVKLEKEGRIAFENRLEFQPFSLNIRIGKLYREALACYAHQGSITLPWDDEPLGQEEFKDKCLQEVDASKGVVITPGERYFYEPVEKLFLGRGLFGIVSSRSTYARMGLESKCQDESMESRGMRNDRWCTPLIQLTTNGTKVEVAKGDPVAQVMISDGQTRLLPPQVLELVDHGELVVRYMDQAVPYDLLPMIHGVVLTMDKKIKVYNGAVLRAGTAAEGGFDTITIPKKGLILPDAMFFLSVCEQELEIPDHLFGEVFHDDSTIRYIKHGLPGEGYTPPRIRCHPNAPYIGPRSIFKGKIAFENLTLGCQKISPGMKQSEIYFGYLSSTIKDLKKSRYHGQTEACIKGDQ